MKLIDGNGNVNDTAIGYDPYKHALVQAVFADNTASLNDQSSWVEKVTHMVEAKYYTTHVNIVAHSMEGLDSNK